MRWLDKLNTIYLHLQKTLVKVLTDLEILPPLKPHDHLIMALSYRRIFSMQTCKSSLTSRFLMILKWGKRNQKVWFLENFHFQVFDNLEIECFKHLSVLSKLHYLFVKSLAYYKAGLECVIVMLLHHEYKSQCVYSCLSIHCPKMKISVSSGPKKTYFK